MFVRGSERRALDTIHREGRPGVNWETLGGIIKYAKGATSRAAAPARGMIPVAPSASPSDTGGTEMEITVTVNGQSREHDVEPRTLLVHYLREACGLTGTNVGCDTSSCGACTVHLDGESVKSCTVLAVQADGA